MGNFLFGLIWIASSLVLGEAARGAGVAGKRRFERMLGIGREKKPKKLTGGKK